MPCFIAYHERRKRGRLIRRCVEYVGYGVAVMAMWLVLGLAVWDGVTRGVCMRYSYYSEAEKLAMALTSQECANVLN